MKPEQLPDSRIADVRVDDGCDRSPGARLRQAWRRAHHRADRFEWLVNKWKRLVEDRARFNREREITLDVTWAQAPDRVAAFTVISCPVDGGAVMEPDTIERVHGNEPHVVFHATTGALKELRDQLRRGEDRWTGIEREPVLPEHRRATAGFRALLDQFDIVPARRQSDGDREATESGANDDNFHAARCSGRRTPRGTPPARNAITAGNAIARVPNAAAHQNPSLRHSATGITPFAR